MLGNPKVVAALKTVDNNILKLDSAISSTMRLINQPRATTFQSEGVIEDLKQFGGECIVQTLLLRGTHNGKHFDNTTDKEIEALIEAYRQIKPREVMIYTIDRATPEKDIDKLSKEEMLAIGKRIEEASGVKVQVNV